MSKTREEIIEAARAAIKPSDSIELVRAFEHLAAAHAPTADERTRVEQANEIAKTVIDVAQEQSSPEFVALGFRYGIADALWAAGYRKSCLPVQGEPTELTKELRYELFEGAVDSIERSATNRTQAYNIWNNLASDPRFVRAILAFNKPAPESRGEPRHFAPCGATNALCDETVPRGVAWDEGEGEYADQRFTVKRYSTTCEECRFRMGLGPAAQCEPQCTCHPVADPWTYYGIVEPGGAMEPDPDCVVHFPTEGTSDD